MVFFNLSIVRTVVATLEALPFGVSVIDIWQHMITGISIGNSSHAFMAVSVLVALQYLWDTLGSEPSYHCGISVNRGLHRSL